MAKWTIQPPHPVEGTGLLTVIYDENGGRRQRDILVQIVPSKKEGSKPMMNLAEGVQSLENAKNGLDRPTYNQDRGE